MNLRKVSQEEKNKYFIDKAHKIHPVGRYGYEFVIYKGDRVEVNIKCNECFKIFKQTPNKHFHGHGCHYCGGSKPLNNETFITRSQEIHGNLYDYELVDYKNNRTDVKIKCNHCGKIFLQRPCKHLMGRGCPDCGAKKGSINTTKSFEAFVSESTLMHGNKFTYFKQDYKNRYQKTDIKCNTCEKIFKQIPGSHIQGRGCPFCAGNMLQTTEQFIASIKHIDGNDFNYDLTHYTGDTTPVIITCNNCDRNFKRRPCHHRNGAKCPYCIRRVSLFEIDFLNYCDIPYIYGKNRQLRVNPYSVDGYDDKTNTIYEYLGDYWHGNPEMFDKSKLNKICKKTFGKLYDMVFKRFDFLKSKGYNIKYIWENDWKKFIDGVDNLPKIITY